MAVFSLGSIEVRPVEGFGGHYSVGNDGSVWRDGARLIADRGMYVSLSGGGRTEKVRIAYLVARAFLPNSEMRPWVRHLNGDPRDNRAANLEWSEKREELRGRRRVVEAVTVWRKDDGALVGSWKDLREACAALGVAEQSARRMLAGKAASVKGYVFKS